MILKNERYADLFKLLCIKSTINDRTINGQKCNQMSDNIE